MSKACQRCLTVMLFSKVCKACYHRQRHFQHLGLKWLKPVGSQRSLQLHAIPLAPIGRGAAWFKNEIQWSELRTTSAARLSAFQNFKVAQKGRLLVDVIFSYAQLRWVMLYSSRLSWNLESLKCHSLSRLCMLEPVLLQKRLNRLLPSRLLEDHMAWA